MKSEEKKTYRVVKLFGKVIALHFARAKTGERHHVASVATFRNSSAFQLPGCGEIDCQMKTE